MGRFASSVHAAVSALTVSAASAADLPSTKAPPPIPVMALYSWQGFYAGLNLGYGWAQNDAVGLRRTVDGVFIGSVGTADSAGVVFGAQIGYNWQNGPWVYGIEADIQGSDIRDSFNSAALAALANPTRVRVGIDWFGTLRLRAGYSFDRTLLYVTGGGALVDLNVRVTDTAGPVIRDSATLLKWTAGAGVEHAFGGGWSGKLEYLYVAAGPETMGGGFGFTTKAIQSFHLGRIGVNYRW